MSHASYQIKDWSDVERSFRVVASTSTPLKRREWDDGKKAEVEYFEALDGWDFSRYEKNPLVFESHNTIDADAVIGWGSDLKETPDGGLEMKITLAPVSANERTATIERRIKSGLLRGVSVGWDYGHRSDEKRGQRDVRVYRKNKLTEVSLTPIPADEDALVDSEQPDEETKRKERVSNAARELALSRLKRASEARTDVDEGDEHRFDFVGSLGKFTRTQVGGIRVPARLTRTGVLEYRLPDGKVRRELRLPAEVFHADSLATLQDATVTNIENHRGLLTAENWKDATLGHTVNVRRDGKFVEADLLINDAQAIADIENGRLHDISCGYSCKLDMTPGVHEGQPYDAIQRHIRYNHVAVLPKGRGRAGTDVALRLDAKDAVCVEAPTQGDPIMKVIRIDGKDVEYGSEQHINHIEGAHLSDLTKWEKEKTELTKSNTDLTTRCDKAEGKVRAFEKKEEDDKKSEDETKRAAELSQARAFRKRLKLVRNTVRMLDVDEDDEEKMDALDQKSDRDLMLDVIRADARWKEEKFDGKSDDYIQAIYDSVAKSFTRADGIDNVVETIERAKRIDSSGGGNDPETNARANMTKNAQQAWTKQLTS